MASILDAGVLGIFSGIFVFLLVYAVVWGLLSWRKPFGDKNTGVYAIISLAVAFLMSIAPPARTFVTFIAPWYIAFFLVLFFILFIWALFGKDPNKDFPKMIEDSKVYTWIIIVCIVIVLAGLAFTFGQTSLDATQGAQQTPTQTGGQNTISANGQGYVPPGTVVVSGNTNTATGALPGTPGSTDTGDFKTNMVNTLVHPKVMGLFLTMVIAALAIYFLSNT